MGSVGISKDRRNMVLEGLGSVESHGGDGTSRMI